MKRLMLVAASLALITVAGLASAQGGGGGGRGGNRQGGFGGRMGGGLQLLSVKEVQTELKMTQDQIDKVAPKQTELRQTSRDLYAGSNPQDLTQAERDAIQVKITAATNKAVADILQPDQIKRYKQLELQQRGVGAILTKEVAKELKLTDDQTKTLTDMQTKNRQGMMDAMRGSNMQQMSQEDRTAFFKKMGDTRKANDEKMLAVLTPEQTKAWQAMLGPEFKFPENMGFGMMGGGMRGGGRRGGGGGGGVQ